MSKSEKENTTYLSEISEKLDYIIALLMVNGKERNEQIKVLVEMNFTNSKISKILGIPKGTVDSVRAKQKNKSNKS